MGAQTLAIPRGRIVEPNGSSREFRSQALPRYARRTREVDEVILGAYLAGVSTSRIRKALVPMLREEHLSKTAVSRVAARLKPARGIPEGFDTPFLLRRGSETHAESPTALTRPLTRVSLGFFVLVIDARMGGAKLQTF